MYLKNNLEKINSAISETWSHQDGVVIEDLQYTGCEDEAAIILKIQFHQQQMMLTYSEKDHNKATDEESLISFLNDLNTDIALADIMHKFPELDFQAFSWPNQYVQSGPVMVHNVREFFSPVTGEFNFNHFFEEKRKATQNYWGNVRGLSGLNFQAESVKSRGDQPVYPENYRSELIIKQESINKPNIYRV
ncbi:MAG: hypothetical protein H0W64_09210 [Gammaproteobacteria bacterium]|nr:hypothetical protein [Gammaproteobacteria bacterium]